MIAVSISAAEANPVVARSVGEFVDVVTQLNAAGYLPWYRGHKMAEWDVLPSIWRGYTPIEEQNLTNRFRSRAAIRYSPTPAYNAHAGWLSLMQHYGLPSRLLGSIRSPMVAMYFALEDYLPGGTAAVEGDAAVWVLYPHELNEQQKNFSFTPAIDGGTCAELIRPAFTDQDSPEDGTVVAAMASETDLRMFVRRGCFTIHSSQMALNRTPAHPRYLRPIVLEAQHIPRMAREIYSCGFRQGDMFPRPGQPCRRTHPRLPIGQHSSITVSI